MKHNSFFSSKNIQDHMFVKSLSTNLVVKPGRHAFQFQNELFGVIIKNPLKLVCCSLNSQSI